MSPSNPSFSSDYDAASSLQDKAKEGFENVTDKASRALHDVTGKAEDFANRAAEQARTVGGQVQQVAGNLGSTLEQSIQDRPMTTLAAFAVAGFVLGALWKS